MKNSLRSFIVVIVILLMGVGISYANDDFFIEGNEKVLAIDYSAKEILIYEDSSGSTPTVAEFFDQLYICEF